VAEWTNNHVEGFLRADGQKLVNGNGDEIILRGVGLGSWMLPEGYMWKFFEHCDRPRRIEKLITDLIGEAKAETFWETYYDTFITESDVKRMAEEGMNSVRLPINSRYLLEDGEPVRFRPRSIERIDTFIAWCRKYRLYVILDLHGAPGGQTGTNIDDSEHDQPELFLNEAYAQRTIELWRMLADRYKDEWIVGGYDLLNEPLPEWFSAYYDRLMPLYRKMTAAIREVDTRHMIILEGVHWSTDWSVFTELFDDNILLQFHKYWSNPDTESIQKFLNDRERLNAPIYMGEGGENNLDWYAAAFTLYEDHHISWNFWTWKKVNCKNSPCSIDLPDGWDRIISYIQGGEKPGPEEAEHTLNSFLHNLIFEHCTYYPDVFRALQRKLPVQFSAAFYGHQGEGIGYHVNQPRAHEVPFRANDKVHLQFLVEQEASELKFDYSDNHEWAEENRVYIMLNEGDWTTYSFYCDQPGKLLLSVRTAAPAGSAKLRWLVDGVEVAGPIVLLNAEWDILSVKSEQVLAAGHHSLKLQAVEGECRVDWIKLA